MLALLGLSALRADERVAVSFSVQAVRIQDTIAARLGGNAQWAFVAVDVGSGKRIVEAGSATDLALAPASLMKLLVAGAALDPHAKEPVDLATSILTDGQIVRGKLKGSLIIKGGGNAFLSSSDLEAAVEKIRAQGITEITGDLVVDDSLFETKGWKSRYQGAAYGVPSALGLDLHTISIMAEAGSRKFVVDPPNSSARVIFNPEGKAGIRQIDDLTYEVTGSRPGAPMVRSRFALADPAMYAGGTFLTLLKQAGVSVAGEVRRGTASEAKHSATEGTEVTEKSKADVLVKASHSATEGTEDTEESKADSRIKARHSATEDTEVTEKDNKKDKDNDKDRKAYLSEGLKQGNKRSEQFSVVSVSSVARSQSEEGKHSATEGTEVTEKSRADVWGKAKHSATEGTDGTEDTEKSRADVWGKAKHLATEGAEVTEKSGAGDLGKARRLATEVTEDTEEGRADGLGKAKHSSSVAKEIARIEGRKLDQVITDMNHHSLNVVADNLLFMLGAKASGAPGTREKGIAAVKDFLAGLDVPTDGMVLDDGSGVSEKNRITPAQMTDYLKAAAARPWFTIFYASLSRPGMDGRLKDFGYKTERVRAKSGQLREAYCLAGYVERADGGRTAFAYMVNGEGSDIHAAPEAAAEALRILVE